MDLIQNIMALLDAELADINRERGLEDLPSLKTVEIKILGQMSLLMDPKGEREESFSDSQSIRGFRKSSHTGDYQVRR